MALSEMILAQTLGVDPSLVEIATLNCIDLSSGRRLTTQGYVTATLQLYIDFEIATGSQNAAVAVSSVVTQSEFQSSFATELEATLPSQVYEDVYINNVPSVSIVFPTKTTTTPPEVATASVSAVQWTLISGGIFCFGLCCCCVCRLEKLRQKRLRMHPDIQADNGKHLIERIHVQSKNRDDIAEEEKRYSSHYSSHGEASRNGNQQTGVASDIMSPLSVSVDLDPSDCKQGITKAKLDAVGVQSFDALGEEKPSTASTTHTCASFSSAWRSHTPCSIPLSSQDRLSTRYTAMSSFFSGFSYPSADSVVALAPPPSDFAGIVPEAEPAGQAPPLPESMPESEGSPFQSESSSIQVESIASDSSASSGRWRRRFFDMN